MTTRCFAILFLIAAVAAFMAVAGCSRWEYRTPDPGYFAVPLGIVPF